MTVQQSFTVGWLSLNSTRVRGDGDVLLKKWLNLLRRSQRLSTLQRPNLWWVWVEGLEGCDSFPRAPRSPRALVNVLCCFLFSYPLCLARFCVFLSSPCCTVGVDRLQYQGETGAKVWGIPGQRPTDGTIRSVYSLLSTLQLFFRAMCTMQL